jgi:hypothetical protein
MTKKNDNNKNNSAARKLIPAIGMLTVSAMMLSSSTYAWFSMNKTVTVDGMSLTAKSNNTFLLINQTETTASGIQTAGLTEETFTDADAVLYPASPALTATEAGYLTTSGKDVTGAAITTAGVQVDDAAKAAAVTNWFTAYALAPGAAAIDAATARQLTSFTDYALVKTVYLTVAAGSDGANNLTITPTFTQKTGGTDLTAAKVLVTTSDGGFANLSSANNGSAVDISGDNTTLTDSSVLTVNFYIYYDGDETPVYTNNMANLKGADFEFEFNVDVDS